MQNRNTHMSRRLLLVLFALLWTWGCQTVKTGVCRDTAPYCAGIYAETQPSEVVLGRNKGSTIWHMQARTLLKGKWQWVEFKHGDCFVTDRQEVEFDESTVHRLSVVDAVKYLERFFPNLGKGGEGEGEETGKPAGIGGARWHRE